MIIEVKNKNLILIVFVVELRFLFFFFLFNMFEEEIVWKGFLVKVINF